MATVVSFSAVSVLLLMCGPLLQHVSAANSLKALNTVSRTAGSYSNAAQVEEQLLMYNQLHIDNLTVEIIPLDIPALNDKLPMFLQQKNAQSGVVLRTGVILHYNDATVVGYFTFNAAYNYIPGQDITDLTLDDLNEDAQCMAGVISQGEEVIHDKVCIGPPSQEYLVFSFILTCTSMTALQGDRMKDKYFGESLYFDKVQHWLVGHQDYVSPCDV